MRKGGSACLLVAFVLLLLAVFIILPSGAGPGALEREMGFWGGLQNSLYDIDVAKAKWADSKHKADGDLPTMEELAPYLGEMTNHMRDLSHWELSTSSLRCRRCNLSRTLRH